MNVIKRNGETAPLDLDKVHQMVEFACEGVAGVSESQVEMNANLQFFDGIKTSEIQDILIKSASDLISLESPNYQYVSVCCCSAFVSKCFLTGRMFTLPWLSTFRLV